MSKMTWYSNKRKTCWTFKLSFHFHLNFLSHRFQFLCKQKIILMTFYLVSVQQQKTKFQFTNTWINFKEEKLWYLLESERKKKCLQISKNEDGNSQLIKMNLRNFFYEMQWKKILRWNKNCITKFFICSRLLFIPNSSPTFHSLLFILFSYYLKKHKPQKNYGCTTICLIA